MTHTTKPHGVRALGLLGLLAGAMAPAGATLPPLGRPAPKRRAPPGHLPWATARTSACALCLEPVQAADADDRRGWRRATAYLHDVDTLGGPRMRFLWHIDCAAEDAILDKIATNECRPEDDAEADEVSAALHAELRARIASHEVETPGALRAVILILRDFPPSAGKTAMHPSTWGAEVRIHKPAHGQQKRTKRDRKKR